VTAAAQGVSASATTQGDQGAVVAQNGSAGGAAQAEQTGAVSCSTHGTDGVPEQRAELGRPPGAVVFVPSWLRDAQGAVWHISTKVAMPMIQSVNWRGGACASWLKDPEGAL